MFTADDHRYMARALQLAERGRFSTHPNPRVGCVIVNADKLVGEGFHARAGEAHAEVKALAQAGEQARGATAYVTLEPCSHYGRTPPCSQALIDAGVNRVVAAMIDPNPKVAGRGLAMLEAAGIATANGLMEADAMALNAGFISRMSKQRPFVRLKMAASLDGRTAMANGDSVWITGDAARQDVQRLRAQADAIITGVGTVLADNPSLNVRYDIPEPYADKLKQPIRIILDSELQTPTDARILSLAGDVLIFTASSDADKRKALQAQGVEVCEVARSANGLDLQAIFSELSRREINECHVECGATLAGNLIEQNWVDELVLYQAPCLMGSDARPLVDLPISEMADTRRMRISQLDRIGEDIRMVLHFT